MKFQEHAHHLFDAIRRNRILFGMADWDEERRAMANLRGHLPRIEQMPVYVLRDPANETFDGDLFEIAAEWLQQGRIKLPFPRMLLQIRLTDTFNPGESEIPPDDIWVIMATAESDMDDTPTQRAFFNQVGRGDENAFWIQVFRTVESELFEWIQPCVMVRANGGLLHLYSFGEMRGDEKEKESLRLSVMDAAGYLVATLTVMDSPSIEVESVKIPKQLNRGRHLINKSRIPDHTVLRLPKVAYAAGEHQGGTHRRPRTHWRRPHTRHLPSGKEASIPLTLVAKVEGQPAPPPPVTEIVTRKP